jgi:hypothetical protein
MNRSTISLMAPHEIEVHNLVLLLLSTEDKAVQHSNETILTSLFSECFDKHLDMTSHIPSVPNKAAEVPIVDKSIISFRMAIRAVGEFKNVETAFTNKEI